MNEDKWAFNTYFKPKKKQLELFQVTADEVFLSGARGSGKSYPGAAYPMRDCLLYPKNFWVIVRKYNKDLRDSCWATMMAIFGSSPFIKKASRNPLRLELINGSEIKYLGIDTSLDDDIQRIRSMEISGFVIEEASEVSYKVYMALRQIMRRKTPLRDIPAVHHKILKEKGVVKFDEHTQQDYLIYPKKSIVISNPVNCWLYDYFILRPDTANRVVIHSKMTDNYDENDPYIEHMKSSLELDLDQFTRMFEGKWEFIDKSRQLYTNKMIETLNHKKENLDLTYFLGVDVATKDGADSSVLMLMRGQEIVCYEELDKHSLPSVAGAIMDYIKKYNIDPVNVIVDIGGIGASIIDMCNDFHRIKVSSFDSRGKTTPYVYSNPAKGDNKNRTMLHFQNLKAQAYWQFHLDLMYGTIFFSEKLDDIARRGIISDLSNMIYLSSEENNGKFGILSKEKTKQLYGKSPDIGEALIYANWARHLNKQRHPNAYEEILRQSRFIPLQY